MTAGIGTVIAGLASLTFEQRARDDDAIDRLNHVTMYGLLIFLAVVTGTKQFVGAPINCWVPAEYTEKFQKNYVNNHCWINSLYNTPFDESIPVAGEQRYKNDVAFYRWVTVIFLALAFLFQVPRLLWTELKYFSGVNVEKLVGMTTDTVLMNQKERTEKLGHVAEFFHRWVTTRGMPHKHKRCQILQGITLNAFCCYGKRSGHNLVLIYLFIKLMYLLNTIAQFFIISSVLKLNYWTFGLDAVKEFTEDNDWQNHEVFPRIALCDMKIRQLQNINTFTVQCVLNGNLFNEKMFLIVWFCLTLMLIVNSLSFLKWTFELLLGSQTTKFLKRFTRDLVPVSLSAKKEKRIVLDMVAKYMKPDGLFILRMISKNTTDLLTADLVKEIWKRYKKFKSGKGEMTGRLDCVVNGERAVGVGKGDHEEII